MAAPIRSIPPPFVCPGLLKVESLHDRGELTGFMRLDLITFYERRFVGDKIQHYFQNRDDVDLIDGTLRAALGL